MPTIEKIILDLKIDPKFVGTFFGHTLKWVEGKFCPSDDFIFEKIYDLFKYLKQNKIELNITKKMLPELYQHGQINFDSILKNLKFKKKTRQKIFKVIPSLRKKFQKIKMSKNSNADINWIIGQLRNNALGNISLKDLKTEIESK